MSILKLLGAMAVLTTALATAASAQEVIVEPGYCAFYYPNANCQNLGPGNPNDRNYQRGPAQATWSSDETVGVAGTRARTHRSRSSAVRSQ